MGLKGFFELRTSADMLRKLEHEYSNLMRDPQNAFQAFNFFETAEHMLDWLLPGSKNNSRRKSERKASVILQICSHVANGAKHLEVEAKHHNSVSDTEEQGGYFPSGWSLCANMHETASRFEINVEGGGEKSHDPLSQRRTS